MRTLAVTLLILALAIPFGGAVAQDDTPAITITSPAAGAVLEDLDAITVTGTGTALFENSLTIRALDSTGAILDEQPVTTDAPEAGGTGNWSATLAVDVAPGTTGSIYAFALSAEDGSVVAQAQVNVTYGTAAGPEPAITITSPTPGAIVANAGAINVTGTATAVHEGVVTVRALGAADAVLVEVTTTAEGAATGGTGDWEATLNVNVAAGTIGKIVALSTSAEDGSVVAAASVSVIYGEAPMRSIRITGPAAGSLVGTLTGFTVTGTSLNIPEGNVVVQARDSRNNVLAQRAVTSSAAAGEGNWQAALMVILPADTPGNIYAFSTSPADGSVLAFDQVNVTFQANCAPRTDWTTMYTVAAGDTLFSIAQQVGSTVAELAQANCLTNASVIVVGQQIRVPNPPASPVPSVELTITGPTAGAVVDFPVAINGTIAGAGTVVVRALDNLGNVLAEERMELDEAGPFQVSLPVTVESGTRGTIYVYSPSAVDGSPVASAAVNVAYGADTAVPVIFIASPLPYTTLTETPVAVSGSAESLFEGTLVVEAQDDQGNVLAQVPATASPSEVGGTGDWTASLAVNVPAGTRGSIVAYATSPQDGSRTAEARIDVIFGAANTAESYVSISSPLPGTRLPANEVIPVAGYSRNAPTFTVVVALIDEAGQVLALQTAPTDPQTGFWQVELLPSMFEPETRAHIVALFATQPNGTVTETDRVGVIFESVPADIAG